MSRRPPLPKSIVLLSLLAVMVGACNAFSDAEPVEDGRFDPFEERQRARFGTITGDEPITLFSTNRDRGGEGGGGGGIGVNAYIWQATLDTINFIPLASADPFGGLIITDWFQSVDAPGERVKMHVQIRDAALRADAVRVSVFRQVRNEDGDWLDAAVEEGTARSVEDHILTRARELRMGAATG
jgi:hypothetical protein